MQSTYQRPSLVREVARKAHCVAWLLAGIGVLVASTR